MYNFTLPFQAAEAVKDVYSVRALTPNDAGVYSRYLGGRRSIEELRRELSDPRNVIFLVFKNDRPVGRGCLNWQGEVTYGLNPDVQGKGLMKLLWSAMIGYARKSELPVLKAEIDTFNEKSRKTADGAGFRRSEQTDKFLLQLRAM